MPITSRSFIRATILLLIVGFVSVFAIIASALWLAGRNDTQADDLVDALLARREAFAILNLILDAETGQRGFVLTQDEAYLEPYNRAVPQIQHELTGLRTLAVAQPRYREAVEALEGPVAAKLAELRETIELVRSGRMAEAEAIVASNAGKAAMDQIRETSGGLIASTDSLVQSNTAALRASAAQLLWVLAAGGFVILGVVGTTSWMAWRYTRDLELTRTELMNVNTTLEARVRERTEDVARANEEIQRFAYIVSHDLRAPLVNIMGFTSELQSALASMQAYLARATPNEEDLAEKEARVAVDSDMPEALGFIRSSTSKMDRLINAILKLSREGQRKLTPELVKMGQVIEAAKDSVQHRLVETGAELEIAGPLPDLVTDRLAVEQIFGNLIDNAVKYMDPARPGRIEVRARETPMGVEFTVDDNGRGIAAGDQERIFDLFRRAGAQDRPGEGIGLSHVRALVRRIGGTISVRSEPGVGSTFAVRLPKILSPINEGQTI